MTAPDPTEAIIISGVRFAGAAPARERRSYRRGYRHGFVLDIAVCALLWAFGVLQ